MSDPTPLVPEPTLTRISDLLGAVPKGAEITLGNDALGEYLGEAIPLLPKLIASYQSLLIERDELRTALQNIVDNTYVGQHVRPVITSSRYGNYRAQYYHAARNLLARLALNKGGRS